MLKGQTPGQTLHQTVWTKSVKKKFKKKKKKVSPQKFNIKETSIHLLQTRKKEDDRKQMGK